MHIPDFTIEFISNSNDNVFAESNLTYEPSTSKDAYFEQKQNGHRKSTWKCFVNDAHTFVGRHIEWKITMI